MNLETEFYQAQVATWPDEGRVILAQYDDDSVVVYQAYRPPLETLLPSTGTLVAISS